MHARGLLLLLLPLGLGAQVDSVLKGWLRDKDLKAASISYCVLDAKSGEVLAGYDAERALVPASTLKVVTTSAAIGLLGPHYRYSTRIWHSGTFHKETGVLEGDLIVQGSGDPSLQSEYFTKDRQLVTDTWAKALKEKGLKEVRGRIVGDASCFERNLPDGWVWGDIGNYYGATPCGLSFMDNKFTITFKSKEPGSAASITGTYPNYLSQPYSLNAAVIARGSEDEAYVYGPPFGWQKDISGSIPPNRSAYEVEAALPDPALLCAESLYGSLKSLGIACSQATAASSYLPGREPRQLLYTHLSPTLDKIVYHTNLRSNNSYCEALLRTMGKGSMRAGIEAVKSYWKGKGLDTETLFMTDGSGLSRSNTLSTGFQAGVLYKVFHDTAAFRVLHASFPIAGRSGGLSGIGKGSYIENNMRAKTGYITRARGYCGYVRARSGRQLAFSVLMNNYSCSPAEAKAKLEKFLVAIGEL